MAMNRMLLAAADIAVPAIEWLDEFESPDHLVYALRFRGPLRVTVTSAAGMGVFRCTFDLHRAVTRWEHVHVLDAIERHIQRERPGYVRIHLPDRASPAAAAAAPSPTPTPTPAPTLVDSSSSG